MLRYIIKRILTFIPMLIAISLIAFVISINAPGDPVERMTQSDQEGGADANAGGNNAQEKDKIRKELGLNLPIFYFSVSNYAFPKDLHTISNISERENLSELINRYGNWSAVKRYYKSIKSTQKIHQSISTKDILKNDTTLNNNQITEEWNKIGISLTALLEKNDDKTVIQNNKTLNDLIGNIGYFSKGSSTVTDKKLSSLISTMKTISATHKLLSSNSQKWKTYIPTIKFYGIDNQYNLWLFGNGEERKGIIRGDFGKSYNDKQLIWNKLKNGIGISFLLSIFSIFIAYLISIPIGIFSAYKKDSLVDKSMSLVLFILYSLPSFFIGTLLLLWFANSDNLYWFPEGGLENAVTVNQDWAWWHWEAIKHRAPYLVLPLITYTYGSFAFLSRIMRIGMIDVISQDYIRTARAKGLSERTVILKHALRNSLLPIITVFAAVFPMAIGGSIIIEVIFSIPGMGNEIFVALKNNDYPMIISFFTLAGLLTMVGYLVSDILYALVDPRISYK